MCVDFLHSANFKRFLAQVLMTAGGVGIPQPVYVCRLSVLLNQKNWSRIRIDNIIIVLVYGRSHLSIRGELAQVGDY